MIFRLGKYSTYIVLIVGLIASYSIAYKASEEEVKITVTGKERITTGSGEDISSKFVVYSESEVFENTDSWLYFKFNSSDYQNKLKVGETYNMKVAGWRVPFFSMYRNIVSE